MDFPEIHRMKPTDIEHHCDVDIFVLSVISQKLLDGLLYRCIVYTEKKTLELFTVFLHSDLGNNPENDWFLLSHLENIHN